MTKGKWKQNSYVVIYVYYQGGHPQVTHWDPPTACNAILFIFTFASKPLI